MNLAPMIESHMTVQHAHQPGMRMPAHAHQHMVHHRDPSPVMSVLVVIGFIAMSIGVVVFTTYLEHASKSKPHEPAHNIPMVHMR